VEDLLQRKNQCLEKIRVKIEKNMTQQNTEDFTEIIDVFEEKSFRTEILLNIIAQNEDLALD
jgi:hypothetical protein